MQKPFRILCLSGAGNLGLYSVSLLEALERQAVRPLARHCDIIAVTSVGAITTIGLAAEIPLTRIKTTFEQIGKKIFLARPAPRTTLGTIAGFVRSLSSLKYESIGLRMAVETLLGRERANGDLRHRVMVSVVNLTKGTPRFSKHLITKINIGLIID